MVRVRTDEYGETVSAPTPVSWNPPPPPPPQVVDRVAYLQQQRQQQIVQQQGIPSSPQTGPSEDAIRQALSQGLPQLIQQGINIAPSMLAQSLNDPIVRVSQFRSEQEAIAEAQRRADRGVQGVRVVFPSEEVGKWAGIGDVARVAQNIAGPLTQDIPYADRVANVAGQIGERVGQTALRTAMGPGGVAEKLLPEQYRPSTIAGNVTGFAAETLVPTEVWQAALELIPGIGTVPDLVRAFKAGTPEAITAVTRAGERIGAREEVQRALKTLSSERGSLELPPESVTRLLAKRGAEVTPETSRNWETLPPTYQKLVTSMADAQPLTTRERKVLLASRRREIAQQLRQIQASDLTPQEKLLKSQAAKAGRIIPAQKPIADQFNADEMTEIWDGITRAVDSKQISPWEHDNAVNALNLLFHGERLVQKDLPLALMPSEIKLLGRVYGPEFEAALPRTAPELSRFQQALQVATLPRALQAGCDISAPGRQGILLSARNPLEWLRSWKPMLQSMSSEKGFADAAEAIRMNPRFDAALEHGVSFTFPGSTETAEEAFQSRLIDKLPFGVNRLLRGSERGYTAFLNNLRMLTFEKNANRLYRAADRNAWDGVRLDKELDDLAWFTNVASGRGDLSSVQKYIPALNLTFFSPRYAVSQPQSVYALVRSSPETRKIVAENLAAFFGSGAAVLAGLKMSGLADVEIDPRSTDFGKVRVGNQRINFWGSWQPLARYMAQIASGKRKNDLTGTIEDKKFSNSITAFLRSKLSPTFGVAYDFTVGDARSYEGKDLTKPENLGFYGLDQITPLFVQDLHEALINEGASGLPIAGLGTTGISVQTYKPRESEKTAAAKEGITNKLRSAGIPDRDQTFAENADFRAAFAQAFNFTGELPKDYATFREERINEAIKSGLSPSEARYRFDNHPFVRQVQSRLEKARLEFWKAHPDLLREAIDAGVESFSKEKGEILGR